jgi:hypothetical protein
MYTLAANIISGLNVFGWVDPVNGLHGMMKWVKGNTDGFLKFLSRIVSRFKGKTIDLWVDRAKWHRGKRVAMFIEEHCSPAYSLLASISPRIELPGDPLENNEI